MTAHPPVPTPLAPAPLVLGDNNVWPLRLHESEGGGWLLIDAGLDYEPEDHPGSDGGAGVTSWDVLVEQARAQGLEPGDVRAVLVTHEHIDHAGLAHRWAAPGARIVAGRAGLPWLALGSDANERQREPRFADLRRHGAPEAVIDTWRAIRRPRALRWEPCPEEALDAAEDRDAFTLAGGYTLRIVMAPGHTPGNLVALVEETGELFSGDTVIPTTIPTPGLHYPGAVEGEPDAARWPSLPAFLRSIATIRTLTPTRVYPGHGAIIEEPPVFLDRFEAHHAKRGAKVRDALTGEALSGEAVGVTAFGIAKAVFPRLPDGRLMQAMTEVLGHLDLLEEQRIAERVETTDGSVRWQPRDAAEGR